MNIVFICNEYPPPVRGGIGAFTQTLGRQLVRNGHCVTTVGVYPNASTTEADDRGVRVIRLASRGPRGVRALIDGRALWNVIHDLEKSEGVDVIDGPEMSFWNVPPNISAPCSLRMNGGHHFFSAAKVKPPRRLQAYIEKRSCRRADHLCAVTNYVANISRPLLGLPNEPIEVLPNPVDTDRFRPHPEISATPGRILFLGTVCEKKGIRHLIEALPQIRRRAPHAHLIAAGREWFDPNTGASYTAFLRSQSSAEALAAVQFIGPVAHDDVPALLASAEVCAFPSLMESQGIAWAEAMATGRPLVASSLGPGPEVVRDGVSGLLCDPRNLDVLADSVSRLLLDEQVRQELGAAGREDALTRFAVTSIARKNEVWFASFAQAKQTV